MSNIHFLIIGAQKAGTTSLFEYMRRHPQIHMPADKELSFFNVERNYRRGKNWYLSNTLRNAPAGAVCGEASVGYMRGTPLGDLGDLTSEAARELAAKFTDSQSLEDVVPQRIKEMLPHVRLICVLRDPVARAHSHYRMEVLNKVEHRTFDQAITQLMEPQMLAHSRIAPTGNSSYVVNGEYFRIISAFLRFFKRDQLLAIFSDDLVDRGGDVLRSVFEFVEVTPDYLPDNMGARYRTAATERRIPGLDLSAWQTAVARVGPARFVWHALPRPMRERIDRSYRTARFRVAVWNAKRGSIENDGISDTTRDMLVAHYRRDSEALAQLLEVNIPWLAAWEPSG
jgi:Sulfotransferase domain